MNRDRLPMKPQQGLTIAEFEIPARDQHPIRVRCYRQTASEDQALPLYIYLHGGGYVTGSLETDDASCRAIAVEIPILVLNVEYRLAPEHKFPVGLQDCLDVVLWASSAEGQSQLNVDLAKGFLLGGTSAGANFTNGIAHLVRDEEMTPPLTGIALLAGNVCHPDARPEKCRDRILSIDEINDAPGLTRKSIDYFAAKYGGPASDKRVSPLLFESHNALANKAFFAICGWDPRRDESLLFEQLLSESGIETKKHVYPGLPHGFWTTCPTLEVSRQWEKDYVDGVRWLLG